jgi:hypothetical protein
MGESGGHPGSFLGETLRLEKSQSESRGYVPRQPVSRICTECGAEFLGRPNRLTCSRRCIDARYRRLHPHKAKEAAARKQRRRRERRKALS